MIQGIILGKVIKLLLKQFNLDKMYEYVFEENELDRKTDDMLKRIEALESSKKWNKNKKRK